MKNNPKIRNPIAETLFKQYRPYQQGIVARRMIASGRLAVELSRGDRLWHVTVLIVQDTAAQHSLNQAFASREEADAYIATLRRWRPFKEVRHASA